MLHDIYATVPEGQQIIFPQIPSPEPLFVSNKPYFIAKSMEAGEADLAALVQREKQEGEWYHVDGHWLNVFKETEERIVILDNEPWKQFLTHGWTLDFAGAPKAKHYHMHTAHVLKDANPTTHIIIGLPSFVDIAFYEWLHSVNVVTDLSYAIVSPYGITDVELSNSVPDYAQGHAHVSKMATSIPHAVELMNTFLQPKLWMQFRPF